MLSVQGTHDRKHQWVFSDPSKYIRFQTLGQTAFDKVCHRFTLVREDLQKALVHQVKAIVPELLQMNYESDSSDDSRPKQLWGELSRYYKMSDRLISVS